MILVLMFSSWNVSTCDDSVSESFYNAVTAFSEHPGIVSANWGLSVFCVKNEKEIFSYNSHKSLSPASTLKALTTSTALSLLSKDYQYKTLLMHCGHIDQNNTLQGNLYIIGSGDPSLGSSRMHDSLSVNNVLDYFHKAVENLGIKNISGDIIADTRIFEKQLVSPKWLWEDIGNYFGAGTSGLSVNENEYTVYFKAAKSLNQPAEVVKVEPAVSGMILKNHVSTAKAGTGDNVYIYGAPYSIERWLTGTVPLGANMFGVRGSLPDPALYFANAFHQHLIVNDINVQGKAVAVHHNDNRAFDISSLREISAWTSPTLEEISYRTNMASVNSYAESLLKTISLIESDYGNTNDGIRIMLDFWEKKGVNINGTSLHDGSGLSPSNRITTNALAHSMSIVANDTIIYESFIKGLPVAGKSGSLKNFFSGTISENNLKAKSGFLSNVRGFTGFTTTKSGRLLAFAFIVNDFNGTHAALRGKMNHIMNSIAENIE